MTRSLVGPTTCRSAKRETPRSPSSVSRPGGAAGTARGVAARFAFERAGGAFDCCNGRLDSAIETRLAQGATFSIAMTPYRGIDLTRTSEVRLVRADEPADCWTLSAGATEVVVTDSAKRHVSVLPRLTRIRRLFEVPDWRTLERELKGPTHLAIPSVQRYCRSAAGRSPHRCNGWFGSGQRVKTGQKVRLGILVEPQLRMTPER